MKFLAYFVLTVVCFVVIAESAELQTAEAVALKPATVGATGSAEGLHKRQFGLGYLMGSALGGGYRYRYGYPYRNYVSYPPYGGGYGYGYHGHHHHHHGHGGYGDMVDMGMVDIVITDTAMDTEDKSFARPTADVDLS